jgi:hypothetical protein
MATVIVAPTQESAPSSSWVSWGAVIAGLAVTVALQILFTEFTVGAGLAAFDPQQGDSAKPIATGTLLAWTAGALLSILIGSWVTGRLKRMGSRGDAALHGALVWATGAVAGLLVAGVSMGFAAAGGAALLGSGISAAGNAVGGLAAGAGPAVAEVAAPNWDELKGELRSGFERADAAPHTTSGAAGETANAPDSSDNRFAERSRMMQLLGNVFSTEPDESRNQADRAELTGLVASQLHISREAADRTLAQWQASWQQKTQQFEAQKEKLKADALAAAQEAKKRAAQAALLAGVLMLLGLGAAVFGATLGAGRELMAARREMAPPAGAQPAPA